MQIPCILTLDAGTTSVKICLFSPTLELLACRVEEYSLQAENGFVEAEAGVYLAAIQKGVAGVKALLPNAEIQALGLTTQGESLVLTGADGSPLCPFLVWLDSRAEAEARELGQAFSPQAFYEETGLPELQGALPLAKALWLRRHRPALFGQAKKLLLLEDFLLHCLTGRFVSEKSLQTSTGWFSLKTDGYWPEALAAAELPAEMLPELLECGSLAGPLTAEAAARFGLPPGLPVVAGAMDQTAAALAAGCLQEGLITETTGTALVMAACTRHPVFPPGHRLTLYRHALPGHFLYLPIANTAGMALRWFRDEFCKDLPPDSYTALDELAAAAPPGCGGLVFLPYLSGCVDPESLPGARGVFFGASLGSTRAHFARSIFEAVAFLLRDFIEMLAQRGLQPSALLSLGGGARSPLWMQMKADVCGCPFEAASCSEAASQGAALLALWGAGLLPRGEMPERGAGRVFTPAPVPGYEEAYALYKSLHRSLRPLFSVGSPPE